MNTAQSRKKVRYFWAFAWELSSQNYVSCYFALCGLRFQGKSRIAEKPITDLLKRSFLSIYAYQRECSANLVSVCQVNIASNQSYL